MVSEIWKGRGPRLSVEQAVASVGQSYYSAPFQINLNSLEVFRESIHDYLAYPPEENPQYPVEQVNFTYLLSLVDVLRVQLFDDDPAYTTLTCGIEGARIRQPIYTTDVLTMRCVLKEFKKVRDKFWMTTRYEFMKNSSDVIVAEHELISCLIPKQ